MRKLRTEPSGSPVGERSPSQGHCVTGSAVTGEAAQVRKKKGHPGNREANKTLMGFNLEEKGKKKSQLIVAAESCNFKAPLAKGS